MKRIFLYISVAFTTFILFSIAINSQFKYPEHRTDAKCNWNYKSEFDACLQEEFISSSFIELKKFLIEEGFQFFPSEHVDKPHEFRQSKGDISNYSVLVLVESTKDGNISTLTVR